MSVTIRFCGASRTVTGSCYLFETSTGRFLVDCGLFQGQKTLKELNYRAFPFRPADIDAVLLTHAHIDHSGLLPKLVRGGFAGRILATRGTIDLCSYMLPDAGSIQESEVQALNRRNAARGRGEVTPIYTQADAIAALQSFSPVDFEKSVDSVPASARATGMPGICLARLDEKNALTAVDRKNPCASSPPRISDRTPNCCNPTLRRPPASITLFRNRPMATAIVLRLHRMRVARASPPRCATPRAARAHC